MLSPDMRGGAPGVYPAFAGQGDGSNFLPLNLFDPFQWSKKMSDEKRAKRRIMEVNNGRLAMIGLFSLLAESKVEGAVPFIQGKLPHCKISAPPSSVILRHPSH